MQKEKLLYSLVAIAFLITSIVMVFLKVITYQEALQGASVWASVIFGIYNWRARVETEKIMKEMEEEQNVKF
ncbi:MAG: hypothetical protein KDH96_02155 [Candidatus Riesia sp.]|nr:hypothetical protein [Candidatus Riesia sp.]